MPATVGKQIFSDGDTVVLINEEVYRYKEGSLADCLFNSIESHIQNDKLFTNWLTVITPNEDPEKFFVPAILCGFNYISVGELFQNAVSGVLDEAEESENDFKEI